MGNVIAGLGMVLVAGAFWVQRGYTSDYGGLFPDPLMIALAALGLVLAALGLAGRSATPADDAGTVPVAGLVRAVLLLVAWIASLPLLGYLVGGVVFFLVTALLMRTERPGPKEVALDGVVSVAVVGVFYLAFTQLLFVRLPELAF